MKIVGFTSPKSGILRKINLSKIPIENHIGRDSIMQILTESGAAPRIFSSVHRYLPACIEL
jgi:hypothetical protein